MCIQLLPNSLYTDVEDEISVDDDPASVGIGVAQPIVSSMLCAWVRLLFYILYMFYILNFSLATEVSVHWSISWATERKACSPSLRIVQSEVPHCIST